MVKTLSAVPRAVLFLAGAKLEKCSDRLQSAYIRRLIGIVLNGGIPSQLVDFISDFDIRSDHFHSSALPLNLPSEYEVKEKDSIIRHFENFKNYYPSKYLSESRLRVLLWDYFMNALVMEGKKEASALDLAPELEVKNMLNLDVSRKVDLALVSKHLDLPILFVEYAVEESEGIFGHKDFTKLTSLLIIACIRLCQKLQSVGSDPSIAKTFGMLVGGTKLQMLVAHPIITDSDSDFYDIHIVVSMNSHWNMSLLKSSIRFECENFKCCGSPLHEVTLHDPETTFNFENYSNQKVKKLKLSDSDYENEDENDLFLPKSSVVNTVLPENTELNEDSVKKIDSLIKCAKDLIVKLGLVDLKGEPKKFKKIKVPNIVNVPESLPSNLGFTPDKSQVKNVTNKNLDGVRRSLINDRSYFNKTRRLTFEYQLYTKYFRNSSVFPQMISAKVNHESKTVDYKFETMAEFMGTGNLSLFVENGKFFGPQIRDQHPNFVIVEAATFALHVLYGLYILHEEFGTVHGDISPRNIMFSTTDDVWKLNDFETAMLLDDSLKTKRRIGTPGYICPEAEETGIYDKSSDIYSFGKVLWSTFVMKLICQVEYSEELPEETHEAVEELMKIVRQMIKTAPSARPTTKKLLSRFYSFMVDNLVINFNVYGKKLIIPRIEALISDEDHSNNDDIEFKKISINE